jgi:hypothetical protein
MVNYREVFSKATGETLFPGTSNVNVGVAIGIREDSRILGRDIGEPLHTPVRKAHDKQNFGEIRDVKCGTLVEMAL